MGRKAIFFDIDGTIWDRTNFIPESTVRAIQALNKAGHVTMINSGRTRAYIQNPSLFAVGFDGIISGCSTMIEFAGETIFYEKIERELAEFTVQTVKECGFRPILEGKDYLYMDPADFSGDPYGAKVTREMGQYMLGITDHWGTWEISKLSCATVNCDKERAFTALAPYYDFMVHNEAVCEIVPKGYHKGIGMQKICERLGISMEDTFAFGDGANDVGMLKEAAVGVAMGSGADAAKEAADYVTAPLAEDGIEKALLHFGLI